MSAACVAQNVRLVVAVVVVAPAEAADGRHWALAGAVERSVVVVVVRRR